jgi:hypothetical protein
VGAIYADSGSVTITNSTITANTASQGGGVYRGVATLQVVHSTISGNVTTGGNGSGPGIFGNIAYLQNTIVAGNTGSNKDIDGVITTGAFNLIGGDPKLGPLQDNGGPTPTMALLPGSPAIDAGDNTNAPEWDQRGPGFPRIVNGTLDIGAFEVQPTRMDSDFPFVVDPLAAMAFSDQAGESGFAVEAAAVSRADGCSPTWWSLRQFYVGRLA